MHIGPGRVAVVEQQRTSYQQSADQEVPHHPSGGGEPEETVLRSQVEVQRQRFQMFEQDAAMPLDDWLGQTGSFLMSRGSRADVGTEPGSNRSDAS
jgi:hypothetical protein